MSYENKVDAKDEFIYIFVAVTSTHFCKIVFESTLGLIIDYTRK